MPATTPGGFPYVLPADHPLEFPSHSQALANTLESMDLAPVADVLTPAAGWADYGGVYAGLLASKVGSLVVLEGMLKRTSDLTVGAGSYYTIGQAPAPFWPTHSVAGAAVTNFPTAGGALARILVSNSGGVQMAPASAGTFATGMWITFTIAYRAA